MTGREEKQGDREGVTRGQRGERGVRGMCNPKGTEGSVRGRGKTGNIGRKKRGETDRARVRGACRNVETVRKRGVRKKVVQSGGRPEEQNAG